MLLFDAKKDSNSVLKPTFEKDVRLEKPVPVPTGKRFRCCVFMGSNSAHFLCIKPQFFLEKQLIPTAHPATTFLKDRSITWTTALRISDF